MRNLELFPDPPRAAVYVLQRRDRQRFKIGWSLAPMKRIRRLPEFGAGQLDLAASTALWLPSRQRAVQVEDAVHKCLAPYAAEVGAGRGGSDWYLPVAHPIALRVLSQIPLDANADRWVPLAPLQSEAAARGAVWVDTGPQDTWWALEDLWSRLAMHCPVRVEREGDTHHVVIEGFKRAGEGAVAALRSVVMDAATYRWRAAGRCGDFVRSIEYRGDDLVCTLAGLRLIESWPDGPDLVWQVEGFLLRLGRLTGTRSASGTSAGERA